MRLRPRALPRPLVLAALAGVVAVLAFTQLGAASAATANVAIGDNTFTPPSITVTVGDTIVWTHGGVRSHTVTADDASFDSANMANGQTFSRTFETPGTIRYFCKIHGAAGGTGMSGTIVVQAAQVSTTTTAAAATTTTRAPTTTTAASTATSAPVTTAPTTAAPRTEGAGVSAETATAQAQPVPLARTGAYTGALAAIGLALVLTGAVVVWQMRLQAKAEGSGPSS